MAKQNELTVQESRELMLNPVYQQVKTFEVQQRMANMYVTSTIVPDTYRGNLGNCVIAIDMAQRMKANPLMVMQNLYVVHGNPAWSAKFLISCINTSGRFAPLRYEWKGEKGKKDYGCRAYTFERTDRDHKEPLYGAWITMEMAEKEGWTKKSGSKWLTMPDQMLIYRAAAFWSRAYAPEISMGFLTKEEAEEAAYEMVEPVIINDEPQGQAEQTEAAKSTEQTDAKPADVISQAINRQARRYTKPAEAPVTEDAKVNYETGELFTNENQQ